MSRSNVEVLRRALEEACHAGDPAGRWVDALNPRAIETVFRFYDPKIEVHEDPRFPESGVFVGHEEVRRYFDQFLESFDEFTFEPEDYIDAGDDRVLVR